MKIRSTVKGVGEEGQGIPSPKFSDDRNSFICSIKFHIVHIWRWKQKNLNALISLKNLYENQPGFSSLKVFVLFFILEIASLSFLCITSMINCGRSSNTRTTRGEMASAVHYPTPCVGSWMWPQVEIGNLTLKLVICIGDELYNVKGVGEGAAGSYAPSLSKVGEQVGTLGLIKCSNFYICSYFVVQKCNSFKIFLKRVNFTLLIFS